MIDEHLSDTVCMQTFHRKDIQRIYPGHNNPYQMIHSGIYGENSYVNTSWTETTSGKGRDQATMIIIVGGVRK